MIIGREPMALIAVNSSKLWMTLTTLGHELKAQGSRCYEQLRAMYDMNNFGLWAQGSKCYEQLGPIDGMKDSRSFTQDSKCYEWIKVMDVMNGSSS